MPVDSEAVRAWLELSCARQGVPVVVTDPGVVAVVGVLMGGRDAAREPPAGGARGTRRSQPPSGDYPARVQLPPTSPGPGVDPGEVQNGRDNCCLAGQVQPAPRVA